MLDIFYIVVGIVLIILALGGLCIAFILPFKDWGRQMHNLTPLFITVLVLFGIGVYCIYRSFN